MAIDNRFKQTTISTLAKRSAHCCSNPSCGSITSGPTSDPNNSVNVGEAAHIYGAHPGSARYNPLMSSMKRSSISNAIWLCSNCHKLIDDDPVRYPAGLLFEWQREHEKDISEKIGKNTTDIKTRYEKRHLDEFGKLSYLSERLILEKEEHWEYQLTAEVLRYEMSTTLRRWRALEYGLYIKKIKNIDKESFILWVSDRLYELSMIVDAFSKLINDEFPLAWGELGFSGNEMDIVTTCRLYS